MKHISGKKIGGSHTTILDEVRDLIKGMQKNPLVKNISPGPIKQGLSTTRKGHLKVSPMRGGIEATIRSTCSIQKIFIYTDDPKATEKDLFNVYNGK